MKYEILSSKEAIDQNGMMHVRDDDGTFTVTVRPEPNDDECFEVDISFDNDSYRLPAGIEQDEGEKDDIRVVEDDVKSQPADIPIDQLAELYIDAAGQLEGIKTRVAMARKLLPAWGNS